MGQASSSMTEALSLAAPALRLPSKATMSFLRTKIWRVPTDPRLSQPAPQNNNYIGIVILRHDGKTGSKLVFVNGKEIYRSNELLDGGDVVRFELGHRVCRLEVVSFPGLTDYVLYCDDRRIRSIMEERESLGIACAKVWIHAAELITLKSSSNSSSSSDKRAVMFEVTCQLQDQHFLARRRFSDFDELDCLIRSAFKGHHLYTNLPALPLKTAKLLTDHFTQEFIEERRADLENFLQKLSVIPHVAENPDFLDFLDIPLSFNDAPKDEPIGTHSRGASSSSSSNTAMNSGSSSVVSLL